MSSQLHESVDSFAMKVSQMSCQLGCPFCGTTGISEELTDTSPVKGPPLPHCHSQRVLNLNNALSGTNL